MKSLSTQTLGILDMCSSHLYMGTLVTLIEGGLTCNSFDSSSPMLLRTPSIECYGAFHFGLAGCAIAGIWVFSSMMIARPLFQVVTQAELVVGFDFLFCIGACQTCLAIASFVTSESWVRLGSSVVANVCFVYTFGRIKPCSIRQVNRIGMAAFIFSACVSLVRFIETECYHGFSWCQFVQCAGRRVVQVDERYTHGIIWHARRCGLDCSVLGPSG